MKYTVFCCFWEVLVVQWWSMLGTGLVANPVLQSVIDEFNNDLTNIFTGEMLVIDENPNNSVMHIFKGVKELTNPSMDLSIPCSKRIRLGCKISEYKSDKSQLINNFGKSQNIFGFIIPYFTVSELFSLFPLICKIFYLYIYNYRYKGYLNEVIERGKFLW